MIAVRWPADELSGPGFAKHSTNPKSGLGENQYDFENSPSMNEFL